MRYPIGLNHHTIPLAHRKASGYLVIKDAHLKQQFLHYYGTTQLLRVLEISL